VYRVDLVCWDRETSRAGSQHARSMNAVRCQKDAPDSAANCVVDRHNHYKGVIMTSGGERGIASYKMKPAGETVVENRSMEMKREKAAMNTCESVEA